MNKCSLFGFLLGGLFLFPSFASAQRYSVRANLLGFATTNLNVEGAMAVSAHWSVHVPLQYNPFNLGGDAKLKNFTVTPGVRYWPGAPFGRGYFIGMHGVFSSFNAGGLFGYHKRRYEGTAWGAGFSAGYAHSIGRKWSMEYELGAGVVRADWEQYCRRRCGPKLGEGGKLYVVPTRISVSLAYLF
ncbi:uncharacterized protein DUF3575 [Bacteroides zoogleoformans]|uniref:DUF3575 domain-containing protein n=1 Tax=Bacteroides zoogleoformans TaxID=28119 RepID=A0ABN5IKW0_9BACE|nr:DUF3575 domain-containing protein [Bacteroides zoogleoformans]AVM53499.1 DUF3575 domain-containing protein [Bacteroides zoogleoformans]TWJ17436.1 uncharacterized protein DUF3575 [Bacteroides zoogleoformans]